jgi:hypothetical protein
MTYQVTDNWQAIQYMTNVPLSADYTGISIPVHSMDMGSVQLSWTGSTSTGGKFIVEASLNNQEWCAVYPDTAAKRTTSGDGCAMYTMETISWPYLRVRYVRGLFGNAGVVQSYLFFKRRRANNP